LALAALIWVVLVQGRLCAHEAPVTRIPVVFDSDAALDDLRALALLVQSDHFELRAVISSDGACAPRQGAINLGRALDFLGQARVPVFVGDSLAASPPPWRKMSETIGWTELPAAEAVHAPAAYSAVFRTIIAQSQAPLIYVCTGPPTNLARLLVDEPQLKSRFAIVYYQGNAMDGSDLSWNTARDTSAARLVFSSGLPIHAFTIADSELFAFDSLLYAEACHNQSKIAQLLCLLHGDLRVREMLSDGHFRVWDESVVLTLLDSTLLRADVSPVQSRVRIVSSWDRDRARQSYLQLVTGAHPDELPSEKPVVFGSFPSDVELFGEDLRPFVTEIIRRHGSEEWRAAVLTNELHGHLGVYSLIGVKMGIRARELLGARLDELRVASLAGSAPPLSCMNDGLQVSTGASLGRGTIEVVADSSKPEAEFILGKQSLHLRLRPAIVDRIRQDIQTAISRFGDLSPEYFGEVRRIAIKYWLELNRKELFDEI
jgi:pyrimidine-specific ribonucleoside hydrolase